MQRLIDPRLGIILRVTPAPVEPELPGALSLWCAEVADMLRIAPWPADRVATGMAFNDETAARAAAIGEAVERYCANFVPAGLRRASYAKLRRAGLDAVDPATLALFSPAQHAHPGFPFVPFTSDLEVLWVEGRDLADERTTLVPASLTYVNYFQGCRAGEPPTNPIPYAGVAAGPNRAAAETAALEELIERDAVMIWWHSGAPAIGLDLAAAPGLRACLLPRTADSRVTFRFVHLETTLEVPVVGALLSDRQRHIVALGTAARTDGEAAARKAAAEAASLSRYAVGLLDPDGDVWRAARLGLFDSAPLKPWRADRMYADAYRSDWRDVVDLSCQSQLYLDPRMHMHVDRLRSPAREVPIGELPYVHGDDRRDAYLQRLEARGLRAVSVDLTTPDVAAAGLCVVRVLVPGLVGNAPAAFPFLGGRRLLEEPALLGWTGAARSENALLRTPIPHT